MHSTLYMGAMVATRWNSALRDSYQPLLGAGKPKKVAVIAVARKSLMQLKAVAHRGTPCVKRLGSACPSYSVGSGVVQR